MRNRDRDKKPKPRWDSEANAGGWIDKELLLSDEQRQRLLAVCDRPEFIQAVKRVGNEYLSRKKPKAPEPKPGGSAKPLREYRARWVHPTQTDMAKTIEDLENMQNKVQKLAGTSPLHPIFEVFKEAWHAEHGRLLESDFFDRLRYLDDFLFMLETTPEDHPQKPDMQAIWEREHKADFEKLNAETIKHLIDIAKKHLPKIYHFDRTNSNQTEKWLGFRLAYVLNEFGGKPSNTKDGPLSDLIGIVLEAAGTPASNPWKYILPEVIKSVKSRRS